MGIIEGSVTYRISIGLLQTHNKTLLGRGIIIARQRGLTAGSKRAHSERARSIEKFRFVDKQENVENLRDHGKTENRELI